MYEASQKFENTRNLCNTWLDRNEKDLSPGEYKIEPLESIIAEKNLEKNLVRLRIFINTFFLNNL